MRNLVFKRLVVGSDILKSGNQFEFKPRFNLITANNNSVGKSTLAKLLLWTLGASPHLDDIWCDCDARCLVDFSIGNENYQVGRCGNEMFLRDPEGLWRRFSKITGDYSSAFAQIVGFNVLLPNKSDASKLEVPPPAFYFLPFYVDQQRSWSEPWNGFMQLAQYSRWHNMVIGYHAGYIGPDFFVIEEQIAENQVVKKDAEVEVEKIETAINVVKTYLPFCNQTVALSESEFDELIVEVSDTLSKLQSEQEELLGSIAKIKTETVYLQGQLELAKLASNELEQDYVFSVECIESESILCPLCGTQHDNSSPKRASILADKDEADRQVKLFNSKLESLDRELAKRQAKIESIRSEIEVINSKYICLNKHENYDLDFKKQDFSFLDGLASHSVQKYVQRTMQKKTDLIKIIETRNKDLKKEQKSLMTKEEKEDLNNSFKSTLMKFIDNLNANGVDFSAVESPFKYKKIYGNGGAAESARGILAYYLAVINQIHHAKNEVFSSIIIDTPNQQEQAGFNYETIINFLIDVMPSDSQLILCAMNGKEIQVYKEKAHVIELNADKILSTSKYEECRVLLKFEDFLDCNN